MPPATQTHVILYGMVWHMGCHWSSRSLISVIGIISINVSKHCVCDCGLIHWWIMIRICSMILRHSADCRRTWRALTEENSYMQFLHFFVNQMLYLQGRCYRGGHGAQFPNVGQFSHQMLCPPPAKPDWQPFARLSPNSWTWYFEKKEWTNFDASWHKWSGHGQGHETRSKVMVNGRFGGLAKASFSTPALGRVGCLLELDTDVHCQPCFSADKHERRG